MPPVLGGVESQTQSPAVSIHVIREIVKIPRASWHVVSANSSHTRFRAGMDRVRCGMRRLFVTSSPDRGTHAVLDVDCGLCGRTSAEGRAIGAELRTRDSLPLRRGGRSGPRGSVAPPYPSRQSLGIDVNLEGALLWIVSVAEWIGRLLLNLWCTWEGWREVVSSNLVGGSFS